MPVFLDNLSLFCCLCFALAPKLVSLIFYLVVDVVKRFVYYVNFYFSIFRKVTLFQNFKFASADFKLSAFM